MNFTAKILQVIYSSFLKISCNVEIFGAPTIEYLTAGKKSMIKTFGKFVRKVL
jgi:hypothetical protein